MQLYFHMIPLLYIIWHNHLLNYRETSCPKSSKTNLPTPDCGEGKHIIYCRAPSKERGFPSDTSGKEPACKYRRSKRCRFNPWLRRSPGKGCGEPLQYSCLENPMDRGAWWATVHRVAESATLTKAT